MNLFLIGCTGFIGRELIPRLIKSDHQLTIVSRQLVAEKTKGITPIVLDPTDPLTWKQDFLIDQLGKSDGIINLAGEPIAEKRWNSLHCELIKQSRLKTTKYLVKAINGLNKPPKVLINGSAIGFYGTSEYIEFSENDQPGKDFLAEVCAEWEQYANQKPKGTRLVILRIGIVLGPDGGALKKMLPVFRTGLGGPIGNGQQWMSWIHRTDICQIIEEALNHRSWSGVINAVAPNPVKMIEFANLLGQSLGRPSLLPVPSPILKLLLGDGAKIVLEGQHVKSSKLKQLGYKFIYPNLKMALAAATKKTNH